MTVEEGVLAGGFGRAVWEALTTRGVGAPRILRIGLPDRYVTHGKPALLHAEVGFTGKAIAAAHRGRGRRTRAPRSPRPDVAGGAGGGLHPQVQALLEAAAPSDGRATADLGARRLPRGAPRSRGGRPEESRRAVVVPTRAASGARAPTGRGVDPDAAGVVSGCTAAAGSWATWTASTTCAARWPTRRAPSSSAWTTAWRRSTRTPRPSTTPGAVAGRSARAEQLGTTRPRRRGRRQRRRQPRRRRRAPRRRAPARAAARLPGVDAAMDTALLRRVRRGPMLTRDQMAWCCALYLGAADRAYPDASPLRWPTCAGRRRPRRRRRARPAARRGARLRRGAPGGGRPAELRVCDDMVHGFLRWGGVVDRAGSSSPSSGAPRAACFA